MLSQATFRERSKKNSSLRINAKINSGIPDQIKSKWLAVIFKMFLSTKIKKPFSSHERSLDTSVLGITFKVVIISATHYLRESRSWDLVKSNARAARESRHESEGRSLAVQSSIATRIASYAYYWLLAAIFIILVFTGA